MTEATLRDSERMILGVRFFVGSVAQAVNRGMRGGLVVVPAAPALKDIAKDRGYRQSLLEADTVLPDSAFMVLFWNLLETDDVPRISGLAYLRELLQREGVRRAGDTLWVMAGKKSSDRNLHWLREEGIHVPESHVYLAPLYGNSGTVKDPALLALLERLKPRHVVVTVGGGKQELLGLFLRKHLSYVPSIHCIGAAIAFLSGDQTFIPVWADRLYLGWLFRVASDWRVYGPRYLGALDLFHLMMENRASLPTEENEMALP